MKTAPPVIAAAVSSLLEDIFSQELQLRRAGAPRVNIHRDVGVSGSIHTPRCQGWHQLDFRLFGGETLVVGTIDRIVRIWQDTGRELQVLWA